MPFIKLNPHLSDYFLNFDTANYNDQSRQKMLADYEAGNVIVFKNTNFGIDFNLFDKISIPPHPDSYVHYTISKLSMDDYLNILVGGPLLSRHFNIKQRKPKKESKQENAFQQAKEHLLATAFKNPLLRYQLAKQMLQTKERILAFYKTMFPEYDYQKFSINWRMTESESESLHVDAYGFDRDFHQVKLFINLDSVPRIWKTGEQLKTLIFRHLKNDPMKACFSTDNVDDFIGKCSEYLFDPKNGPLDCQSTHDIFFKQGEVWMAETRHIPHQIFYGRKMVSAQFYIDPSKRVAPEKSISHLLATQRNNIPPQANA